MFSLNYFSRCIIIKLIGTIKGDLKYTAKEYYTYSSILYILVQEYNTECMILVYIEHTH